ncbi:cytochrome P450 [Zopfia rhizophila CBS 207.26]|uniref:Cytochrome P450 n=1 Tax=Zopfia rhizophila CBS 207.26 TaxID=1314779 RepID=A0A6A6EA68_9PEZI|nr:cytochrome P450 [Zopfia rhizophila CBS 207.26]
MSLSIGHFQDAFSSPMLTAAVCCTLVFLYYAIVHRGKVHSDIPWVALDDQGLLSSDKARMQYLTNSRAVLEKGITMVKGIFRVQTGDGPRIVLPNSFADEIRNNQSLNFAETVAESTFSTYPGFEPMGLITHKNIIQDVVRLKLTRSLEWQEMALKAFIYRFVAKLSSRVFLGPEVCNNEDWLNICVSYTVNIFQAQRVLRTWNPLLRPLVHWFLPECRLVRKEKEMTRQIITPIVKSRLAERKAHGGVSSKTADMVGWIQDVARGKDMNVKLEDAQLLLAVAAIHTTTEALSYIMTDLLDHPEAIPRLREEIVGVLKDGGWKKTSLMQMKLLDSVLKESQRLHPIGIVTLPKGSDTYVTTENHTSPEIYPSPHEFVPDRFLLKRESGDAAANNKWQFVTTSPEHLGFGHGRHACPGRFFASNEIKVALVHLLLKYEWKYGEEGKMPELVVGHSPSVPINQKVMCRRREGDLGIEL